MLRRPRRARAYRAAGLFFTSIAALGCAGGDDDGYFGTTRRIGKATDTFYVNNSGEPEYLDPGKLDDGLSSILAIQLFEGLTRHAPRDDHPTQAVAVSWDQSDDNRLFRFHLRPEARWSDGKQVTAQDFAYSWRRTLAPAFASRVAPNLYSIKNAELFNRGRLLIAQRPTRALDAPREGAAEVAKIPQGAALRVVGRSPLEIASDVAPIAMQPKAKLVSRKKADLKAGTPEQLGFGGAEKPVSADAATSWNGRVVDVLRAGPPVDCDGESDRWYEVADGESHGWIPGCLTKPAKGKSAYLLVARHEDLPTFTPRPKGAHDALEAEPIGFVDAKDLVEDSSVVGVRATDDLTLDVELQEPTPYFIDLTANSALFPVRRDVVEPFEKRGEGDLWVRPESMVSNGPYMLDEWKFRYQITMKANPHYWDYDKLQIKKVVLLEIEEYHATLNLYKAGEIDYVGDNLALPSELMPFLEPKKDFFRTDYLAVYWYELNTKKPPLDDPRVRHALDLAIDKRLICEKVARAGQTPATHFVPDITGLGYSEARAAEKARGRNPFAGAGHDFDPKRARALLTEAGYHVVEEGGEYRTSDMPPVEILYNTSEGHKLIAVAIQDMWKKNLGISVTLRNEEWRVMLKNYRDGNFQVMRFGQIADYNHPGTFLDHFLSGSLQNRTSWGSADFDEAMHAAAAEPDTKKSIGLYLAAESMAVEAMPRIPIYFYTKSGLVKPYVRGLWGTPRGQHLFQYLRIDPDFAQGAPNAPAYEPPELPPPGRLAPPEPPSEDKAPQANDEAP